MTGAAGKGSGSSLSEVRNGKCERRAWRQYPQGLRGRHVRGLSAEGRHRRGTYDGLSGVPGVHADIQRFPHGAVEFAVCSECRYVLYRPLPGGAAGMAVRRPVLLHRGRRHAGEFPAEALWGFLVSAEALSRADGGIRHKPGGAVASPRHGGIFR